jgi:hypothetical protein
MYLIYSLVCCFYVRIILKSLAVAESPEFAKIFKIKKNYEHSELKCYVIISGYNECLLAPSKLKVTKFAYQLRHVCLSVRPHVKTREPLNVFHEI